jgi:type VI secretion system protein ImpH
MAFPASEVVAVEVPDAEEAPVEMTVSFMSLTGPHGPLPDPYAEQMQARARSGDTALRDFLDLLVHRPIALQYRSRKRHHVGMEAGAPGDSTAARYLRAIAGVGAEAAQGRLSVPDHALLRYAALLNESPASAHGLSSMLQDYFEADVMVSTLDGAWIDLAPEQRTTLGRFGQNQALGTAAVLGRRAWDQTAGGTIRVGDLSYGDYLGFLPGGRAHRALVDLSELYLGRTIDLDLALTVQGDTAPATPLSTALGPRLGRDAWLGDLGAEAHTTRVSPDTFSPEQEALRIPLFAGLSPPQLRAVTESLPGRTVEAERHVARQGQTADAFFLVVEGEADVRYQSPESDEPTVLATLEPGGVFGDEALVSGGRYDGSLVTTRPARLLKVSRSRLQTLLDRYPAIEHALDAAYETAEASSLGGSAAEEAATPAPSGGLGAFLPTSLWRPLISEGVTRTLTRGDRVLLEGEEGAALAVLLDGGPIRGRRGEERQTPGALLNLPSVVRGAAPAVSLQSDGPSTVLVLPLSRLRRLMQKHPPLERALRAWRAERSSPRR